MRDRDVIRVVGGLVHRLVGHANSLLGGGDSSKMRRHAASSDDRVSNNSVAIGCRPDHAPGSRAWPWPPSDRRILWNDELRADAVGDRAQRAGRRRHAVRPQAQSAGAGRAAAHDPAPGDGLVARGRTGRRRGLDAVRPARPGRLRGRDRPPGGVHGGRSTWPDASPACFGTDEEPAQGAARRGATGPRPIWRWRWRSSRQTVNAIETGKYDPSLPLAFRLARLFGLSIEDIFQDQAEV